MRALTPARPRSGSIPLARLCGMGKPGSAAKNWGPAGPLLPPSRLGPLAAMSRGAAVPTVGCRLARQRGV